MVKLRFFNDPTYVRRFAKHFCRNGVENRLICRKFYDIKYIYVFSNLDLRPKAHIHVCIWEHLHVGNKTYIFC